MNLASLANESRLLVEAKLKPIQGSRFQPTGFPDLGPATYLDAKGTQMLLVESAQSMANRFENVCWDEAANNWIEPLRGLPFVQVNDKNGAPLTNSVLEAHRLNSIYIKRAEGGRFHLQLKAELVPDQDRPIDLKRLASVLLKYDANALIHGVFLETIDGRLRLPRLLTGFIEARNVNVAASGGVKNDRIDADKSIKLPPAQKGVSTDGDEGRAGNVPFHRDEFCGEIIAFFNVDLSQLRGYGFDPAVTELLIALSIFKVQKLLDGNCRLRTACDLVVDGTPAVTRPSGFALPSLKELEAALPKLIAAASKNFSEAKDREVTFE